MTIYLRPTSEEKHPEIKDVAYINFSVEFGLLYYSTTTGPTEKISLNDVYMIKH